MTAAALKTAAIGKEVVKKEKPTTIHAFLETYKSEITRALPKHMTADRMARIVLTEFRKTPALMKCDPATLFGAVIQCAQLGLEPGGALGHAYLIPFENRKRNTTDVQFIIGYRGMIDLARRSGQIVSLEAHAVYDGDEFECELGLNSQLRHVPDWQNANRVDSQKMKFVYAVAKLKDGGTQFEVMSRAEVDGIRARSKAAGSGPWATDYVAMALKTVIRRLFKFLPVSIELQTAVGLDEQAEADIPQDNGFVIDGTFSDINSEPAPDKHAPVQSIKTPQPVATYAQIAERLQTASAGDALDTAADLIGEIPDPQQREELVEIYKQRSAALTKQEK